MGPIDTREDDVWCGLSAASYDAAVGGSPLLRTVRDAELAVARGLITRRSVLVEVGCGTGQFCRHLVGRVGTVVGVDIAEGMLDVLRRECGDRVLAIEGDARRLSAVLSGDALYQQLVAREADVVTACVMNTLGIMSAETRSTVLHEMAMTAGSDGRVVATVFNGDYFERGIDDFYRRNPRLCGSLDGATIDLATRELIVPATGYYSHWFSEPELWQMADKASVRNVEVRAEGIALLLVGNGCC